MLETYKLKTQFITHVLYKMAYHWNSIFEHQSVLVIDDQYVINNSSEH